MTPRQAFSCGGAAVVVCLIAVVVSMGRLDVEVSSILVVCSAEVVSWLVVRERSSDLVVSSTFMVVSVVIGSSVKVVGSSDVTEVPVVLVDSSVEVFSSLFVKVSVVVVVSMVEVEVDLK